MIGPGFQTLMLPLADIHFTLTHSEFTRTFELFRILGSSYRLATSEVGSSRLHGRLVFHFCRTVAAGVVR